jgi:biofilm protein TabA
MICDILRNSNIYSSLHQHFAKAFEYLQLTDFSELADGKYELINKDLFAIISSYETKPIAEGKWESHQKYIDIQYVISGEELMYYAPTIVLQPKDNYNDEKDVRFYDGEGCPVLVKAGSFAVFFPDDGHMPMINVQNPSRIRKVVLKVKI